MRFDTATAERLRISIENLSMPEPMSGCWIWLGNVRHPPNRPKDVRPRLRHKGKVVGAHRVAYAAYVGPIGASLLVCHRCDQTLCVNPEHLWLGTNADNNKDMGRKGRKIVSDRSGDANPNRKISSEQAMGILFASGTVSAVAERFGVSQGTVRDIKTKRTWRCLSEARPA